MTYGALNTITMADVEHAREARFRRFIELETSITYLSFFPEPFKDPSGYICYFMILSILIR